MDEHQKRRRTSLFVYAALLLILFFASIELFISTTGLFFRLELLGLLFLLLLSGIAFVNFTKAWSGYLFLFVFLFYIGNLLLVWYFYGDLYLILLLLALIGFFLAALLSPQKKKEESHSVVFDTTKPQTTTVDAAKTVAAKTSPTTPQSKILSKHSPGKYVASKQSNVYHEPKCDWAKKIAKNRQLWFNTKENAWEKGYKGHSCVQ
ncbi:hypothetical protein J4421_01405 [Candidatus Woesearchaeota archaeon]|nr:hypothetical protein [Candidatus Woesearchaeota archaeon]